MAKKELQVKQINVWVGSLPLWLSKFFASRAELGQVGFTARGLAKKSHAGAWCPLDARRGLVNIESRMR